MSFVYLETPVPRAPSASSKSPCLGHQEAAGGTGKRHHQRGEVVVLLTSSTCLDCGSAYVLGSEKQITSRKIHSSTPVRIKIEESGWMPRGESEAAGPGDEVGEGRLDGGRSQVEVLCSDD